jgi:hypothetical protein
MLVYIFLGVAIYVVSRLNHCARGIRDSTTCTWLHCSASGFYVPHPTLIIRVQPSRDQHQFNSSLTRVQLEFNSSSTRVQPSRDQLQFNSSSIRVQLESTRTQLQINSSSTHSTSTPVQLEFNSTSTSLLPPLYYLPPTTYDLLPIPYSLLPTTCYLLSTPYSLLPTTYYLRLTTSITSDLLPTLYYVCCRWLKKRCRCSGRQLMSVPLSMLPLWTKYHGADTCMPNVLWWCLLRVCFAMHLVTQSDFSIECILRSTAWL